MKIYLRKIDGWQEHEYSDITELREIVKSHNITIGDGARIGNGATIGDWATIGNEATIGNWARIGNWATIGNWARIGNWATIGNWARIGDGATIGNGATIGDKVEMLKSPLYIIGSSYIVNYYGDKKIQIGCELHTFDEWQKSFEEIGRRNGASEETIKEYKKYIDLIIETYSK